MTTIVHGGGYADPKKSDLSVVAKVMLVALAAWAALGPVIGILYANTIIIRDWRSPAALSAHGPSNMLQNYSGGLAIWCAGLLILGLLSWRACSRS